MPISTKQLSKLTDVSEQTVRNYTDRYGELLSPAARGENGPRLFSDEDVQVFRSIATLRKQDIPPAEVIERVRRGDVYIEATPSTPQATPSPQEAQQEAQALIALYNSQQHQIDALRRALTAHTPTHRDIARAELRGGLIALVGGLIGFTVMWLLVNGGM